MAKPVAPKRSGQVIEKEQKAEKEEEEEDKEMTRLCIFRGAKDKEKKPEEVRKALGVEFLAEARTF